MIRLERSEYRGQLNAGTPNWSRLGGEGSGVVTTEISLEWVEFITFGGSVLQWFLMKSADKVEMDDAMEMQHHD